MHEPVRSHLEEILQGRLNPAYRQAIEDHLTQCPPCRLELGEMRAQASFIRTLKPVSAPEPSAGFYARVIQTIESQNRPSFWNLLLDPIFGRRLVYATASMFLLMAAFLLASSGDQPELARTPVHMIAEPATMPVAIPASFGEDVQRDREHFLVTMASFSD